MKRKVKRYNGEDGSSVEEMKKGLFSSKEDKEQEDSRSTYFKSPRPASRSTLPSAKEKTGTYGPSSSVEPANFKEAFAAARKAGDSSFTFDGKKFTTALASDSKKSSAMENAAKSAKMGVMPISSRSNLNAVADDARKEATGNSFKRNAVSEEDRRSSNSVMEDKNKEFRERSLAPALKKGGAVKKMASGGMTKSASSRADGCAIRGKTRA